MGYIAVFPTIIIWFAFATSRIDAISNRRPRTFSLPVHNYQADGSFPLPDWETGLREATFLSLLREHQLSSTLRPYLLSAPLIGKQHTPTPFGDIAIIARGQLYSTRGGFQFVQDPYHNDCDGCHNNKAANCKGDSCDIWQPLGHERLLALWTIKRIRHRDPNYGLRFELEYTISPIRIPPETPITIKYGEFDYNIPGHTFIVQIDPKTSQTQLKSISKLSNKISHGPSVNLEDPGGWSPVVSPYETQHYLPPPRKILLNTGEFYYKEDRNPPIPTVLLPPDQFLPPPIPPPTTIPTYIQPPVIDPREEERLLIKNLIDVLSAKTTTETPLFPSDSRGSTETTSPTTPSRIRFPSNRKIPTQETYTDSVIKYSEPDPLYTTTTPLMVTPSMRTLPKDELDLFESSRKTTTYQDNSVHQEDSEGDATRIKDQSNVVEPKTTTTTTSKPERKISRRPLVYPSRKPIRPFYDKTTAVDRTNTLKTTTEAATTKTTTAYESTKTASVAATTKTTTRPTTTKTTSVVATTKTTTLETTRTTTVPATTKTTSVAATTKTTHEISRTATTPQVSTEKMKTTAFTDRTTSTFGQRKHFKVTEPETTLFGERTTTESLFPEETSTVGTTTLPTTTFSTFPTLQHTFTEPTTTTELPTVETTTKRAIFSVKTTKRKHLLPTTSTRTRLPEETTTMVTSTIGTTTEETLFTSTSLDVAKTTNEQTTQRMRIEPVKTTPKTTILEVSHRTTPSVVAPRNKLPDDDLFGPVEQKSTTTTTTIKTNEDIGDVFGADSTIKSHVDVNEDLFESVNAPKIIYSNFFIPDTEETTNFESTPPPTPPAETPPPTEQSFSTSISIKIGNRTNSNVENTKANVMELKERDGYRVYKAQLINNPEKTNEELDQLALSVINHAKSIDYLNSFKAKSKRSGYVKAIKRPRLRNLTKSSQTDTRETVLV